MPLRIGILGYGKMGSSIAEGLLSRKFGCSILAYDKKIHVPEEFRAEGETSLLEKSDLLLLCVKPQDMKEALEKISPIFKKMENKPAIVSVASGLKIKFYENLLGQEARIVRVMPNIAATVGESVSCISANKSLTRKDLDSVRDIFSCVGKVFDVDEDPIDAITAISGSGPAYFFYIVEALAEAGINEGLQKEFAEKIAIQALIGSASLLRQNATPKELREKVTSPGGITAAAVQVLENRKLKAIISEAIRAGKKRSKELATS